MSELVEVLTYSFTAISGVFFINRHIKYRNFIQSVKDPFPLPKSGEEFFTIGYPVTPDESSIFEKKYLETGKKYTYPITTFQKVGNVNIPITTYHEGTDWKKASQAVKNWYHPSFKLYFKEFNGREKITCELSKCEAGNVNTHLIGNPSWKTCVPEPDDFKELNVRKSDLGTYDDIRLQKTSIKGNGKYPLIINCKYDKNTNSFRVSEIYLKSLQSFARRRTPWMRTGISAFVLGIGGSCLFLLEKFV